MTLKKPDHEPVPPLVFQADTCLWCKKPDDYPDPGEQFADGTWLCHRCASKTVGPHPPKVKGSERNG